MAEVLHQMDVVTPSRLVVAIAGELDCASAPALHTALDAAVRTGAQVVVVDAAAVDFIDCRGLRELTWARTVLQAEGRVLLLSAPSPALVRLLEWTGLTHTFLIHGRSPRTA